MKSESVHKRRPRRVKMGGSSASSTAESLHFGDKDLNDHVKDKSTRKNNKGVKAEDIILFKDRLASVAVGSKSYAKELRLKTLHRMLMRNTPLDEIAFELGVSIHTVMRDRKELRKRLQDEAKSLDINHLIGDTLGFYNEIQAVSLNLASRLVAPMNMRLAALRTALAAKNDQHRFLNSAGVYDVLRYQAAEQDGQTDIERMVAITEAILEDGGESLTAEKLQAIAQEGTEQEEQEVQML